jgi:hypothetical protein
MDSLPSQALNMAGCKLTSRNGNELKSFPLLNEFLANEPKAL